MTTTVLTIFVTLLSAAGLVIWIVAGNPKVADAARILYWTALATLFYLLVK